MNTSRLNGLRELLLTPELLLSLQPAGSARDQNLSAAWEQTGRDGSGRSSPSGSPRPSRVVGVGPVGGGGARDASAVSARYMESKRMQLLMQATRRQHAVLQRLQDARERTLQLARNLEKVTKRIRGARNSQF